jgi:dihydrofolate reductase
MAVTLDGKIGKSPDHFPDWTGKEDKQLFARLSRQAGVVIMGSKTFDTIGKPLPDRKNVILTRDQTRKSQWENLIFTSDPPRKILENLEKEGHKQAILAGGAMVNALFAEEKLIDELIVTISPVIFGYGLSLFTQEISMNLELLDMQRMGRDLVCLTYTVRKE